ncbi:MAG: alpha/beta hydrolase [Clostridia bacterium]|nr:alpha/beta hydrolase [Clostridia bacterium]
MFKTIDSLNINYTESGEGDLVVLLHGWGSNITLFQHTVSVLERKYKVVAMDMPGFGESDEPSEPWCVDDYVDFVLKFLESYSPEKVTLLGHSFGGRVIIKMCSRELPFEIDKIILVDSAGVKPEKTLKQKTKQSIFKMGKKLYSAAPVQKLFPDALENLRKKNGSADYNAASPVMRQTLVRVVNEDLQELMPNVKAPTLLIWGTADDATPLSDALIMEKLMPEAGLVKFEGAGHYSFLECQAQYGRVLASFMNISL